MNGLKQTESASHARHNLVAVLCCLSTLVLSGCSRLHPHPAEEVVYLQQKDAFLRDHVAAVSNRTGHVVNGERLVVLEHSRRFVRVRDSRNETGWVEDRYVVGQDVYDAFQKLREDSNPLTPVAMATVRDDVAMHLTPGRETAHLAMLKEGDKVQLLRRASTVKPIPPQAMPLKNASPPTPLAASSKPETEQDAKKKKRNAPAPIPGAPAVPMEDWWLVRDAQGDVGWVLGRRFDVDVPDTIAGYAENQRFVAVYTLTTVHDAEAEVPDKDIPVYLALLAPYRDGLPYDFSSARVFNWSMRKHRYETAFRARDLWGYLPAVVGKDFYPEGTEPTFTLHILPGKDGTIDQSTGLPAHGLLDNLTYRMEGEVLKKVQPTVPGAVAKPAEQAAVQQQPKRPAPRRRHRRS